MSERSPKPTPLVFASVGLAFASDLLFRGASWGINVGVWALLVTATVALLRGSASRPMTRSRVVFAVLTLLFAFLFAFRDSDALKAANGIALALCLGAALLPPLPRPLRDSTIAELLSGTLGQLLVLPGDTYELAEKAQREKTPSSESRARTTAILRGVLLAGPLLLVFGALFASADAVFRTKLDRLFRFDLDITVVSGHVWTFLLAFLLAAGLLHRLLFPAPPAAPPVVREGSGGGVGTTEIGIVLGSLAVLFGAFLLVQFRYLFAGRDVVLATAGLSYAEYARGGFFELVCVAALALVVLLTAGATLRRKSPNDDLLYRWLGRLLVAMVLCVVASAALRMKLYTDAFGLTELRVYASVFMGWLAAAFLWLLLTTLNQRPRRFAFGTFLAGLLAICGANLMNPDALIVRTNLAKPNADFGYLKSLSDDSVLAMEAMGEAIPPDRRQAARVHVLKRREARRTIDWRELNLSRWRLSH